MPRKKKEDSDSFKVGTLKDIPKEESISTGIEEVDLMLGGGFPRGRITQVYGLPGVGKSYLLGRCMAALPGKILYIDTEFSLNQSRLEKMGVKLDKIDYIASSELEKIAEYVLDHVSDYDLIVIDTLAKLTPMVIATNTVGENAIGLVARQIGRFEAKLRPLIFESRTAVVGINQVRANFGMSPVQTTAFGGWAWEHTLDLNLRLTKGAANAIIKQVDGEKSQIGHWATVKAEKNRMGPSGLTTKFKVSYIEEEK